MAGRGNTKPLLVAADMGYGHLRAAHSLADAIGTEVLRIDAAPLATSAEVRTWNRARSIYESASRFSQIPYFGRPVRSMLERATAIADPDPARDRSRPDRGTNTLDRLIEEGLGEGLVTLMRETGRPLLTTFYAPAVIADRHGLDGVFCVATDCALHRVWAPRDAARSRVRYFTPTERALVHLAAYGVPAAAMECTGFPLPPELVGGTESEVLKRNLVARIVRLDPQGTFRRRAGAEISSRLGGVPDGRSTAPPLITFAVGGAGAQVSLARAILDGVRDEVERGGLRVALVAGVRPEVAAKFEDWVARAGLTGTVTVLFEPDYPAYYRSFNRLLAETDLLWTKPSELVFYAALGLPLVLSPPVGGQEHANRRWLLERGAALEQRDLRLAGFWIREWLSGGELAAAAWAGYLRLPSGGTERIRRAVM